MTLRIVAIEDGQLVDVDLGAAEDDYLARVVPEASGSWLVAVLPRAQRSLRWLRVQPDGRHHRAVAGAVGAVAERRPAHPRAGRRHHPAQHRADRLPAPELRAPDGQLLRQLTDGEWVVTEVVHVDEARREVLFVGTADGPTQRHLYTVSLDAEAPDRAPQRLTVEPGWHAAVASRDGSQWADTWSSLDRAHR